MPIIRFCLRRFLARYGVLDELLFCLGLLFEVLEFIAVNIVVTHEALLLPLASQNLLLNGPFASGLILSDRLLSGLGIVDLLELPVYRGTFPVRIIDLDCDVGH